MIFCPFLGTYIIFCFHIQGLEPVVHGRGRKPDSLDEMHMGVYEELLYARKIKPVEGKFFKNNKLTFLEAFSGTSSGFLGTVSAFIM